MNHHTALAPASPNARPRCTIDLDTPYSRWFRSQQDEPGLTIQGRGYAFVGERYLEGQGLVDFVRNRSSSDLSQRGQIKRLKDLIPTLNGAWALVASWPDGSILAATDRVRSIPLLYALLPEEFVISSSIESITSRQKSPALDDTAALEFLLSGYVTGNHTLWKDVHQIQAGQIVEYTVANGAPQLSPTRYYRFLPGGYCSAPERQLEEQLESVLDSVFSRLVSALDGRRAIIPLSGGLDSRLVAALLKRHGYENVLCFSYGVRDNEEATISRAVAGALGYEWQFFEYNARLWAEVMNSEPMLKYWPLSCNGTSLPLFQDLPAAMALMDACGRPRDAVFLPGHSGDFLAGSHIPAELVGVADEERRSALVQQAILQHHYDLWSTVETHGLQSSQLAPIARKIRHLTGHPASAIGRYEMWDTEARQALFIINSVRAYEFVGARWMIPLWDYELMDFFATVPTAYRIEQRLYINTLREKIFRGNLSPLATIPRTGIGAWDERLCARRRRPLLESSKAAARGLLRRCGLLDIVREARTRSRPGHYLAVDTWFANGRDPKSLRVSDAMRSYDVSPHLPGVLAAVLQPSLGRRLDLASWNGLLSAIVLTRLYRSASTSGDSASDDNRAEV